MLKKKYMCIFYMFQLFRPSSQSLFFNKGQATSSQSRRSSWGCVSNLQIHRGRTSSLNDSLEYRSCITTHRGCTSSLNDSLECRSCTTGVNDSLECRSCMVYVLFFCVFLNYGAQKSYRNTCHTLTWGGGFFFCDVAVYEKQYT